MLLALIALAILAAILLAASIRIVPEYQRAVVFRLGRLVGVKGPGPFLIIPFVDRVQIVDLRVKTIDVPQQEIITRDNVTVEVDAVIYYRVVDPVKAVLNVANYNYAVMLYAQTSLRDVIGQVDLDKLLTHREEINKRLQEILDEVTEPWGIKVTAVKIKQVKLPESLLRALALQAEAERLRRARVIEAEGERQAAEILEKAARVYEEHPVALRLRELEAIIHAAREKSLIIVVPTQALNIAGPIAVALGVGQREGGGEEKA